MIGQGNQNYKICWVPSHIEGAGNEKADKAAGEAANNEEVINCTIPRDDFKVEVKRVINERWEREWRDVRGNKPRSIKETVKRFRNSSSKSREWEVKLARLRIGHSWLTHKYLMRKAIDLTAQIAQCH